MTDWFTLDPRLVAAEADIEAEAGKPTVAPPAPIPAVEDKLMTGEIIRVMPAAIPAGLHLAIFVEYAAFNPGAWGVWATRITATAEGARSATDSQNQFGEGSPPGEVQTLVLGLMPNKPISVKIILEGQGFFQGWRTLDTYVVRIGLPEELPGVTPEMPPAYSEPRATPPPVPPIIQPVVDRFPDVPHIEPTAEDEIRNKNMWVWAGIGIVGIIGVAMLMR